VVKRFCVLHEFHSGISGHFGSAAAFQKRPIELGWDEQALWRISPGIDEEWNLRAALGLVVKIDDIVDIG
jgi:hypothetical protein